MADDWDVLALYEEPGQQLHQDVKTGRARYVAEEAPQQLDAGQRLEAKRRAAGMSGTDRAAPRMVQSSQKPAQRKMTDAEMEAWARSQLASVQAQREAMQPSVMVGDPEEYGAMLDQNMHGAAQQYRQQAGLPPDDDGPGNVPEWLSRYMGDDR